MFKKVFVILIGVLLLAVGLLYAGVIKMPAAKAHDCGSAPKPENAVVIRMENNSFDPKELSVNVCDTLLFLNLDDAGKHPSIAQKFLQKSYPGFDAGKSLAKFDYFTFQVTRTGTYSFYDQMNPSATGKIIIKEIK